MTDELEICPFCKTSGDMIDILHYYSDVHQVECSVCGARGEYQKSSEEAIKRWNEISNFVTEWNC